MQCNSASFTALPNFHRSSINSKKRDFAVWYGESGKKIKQYDILPCYRTTKISSSKVFGNFEVVRRRRGLD